MDKDLRFTGWYTNHMWERPELTERAADIRKRYKCRARVVAESHGWSIYADQKYRDLHHLEELSKCAKQIPYRRAALREKFEKELSDLDKEAEDLFLEIRKIRDEYGDEFTEDFTYAN